MAITGSNAERRRLLPGSVHSGLRQLVWRAAGAGLIVLALGCWMSLATWSIHDPSFNHATRGEPSNMLGFWGAAAADMALQSLGIAAVFLFLPLAAWGWHAMAGQMPDSPRLRLAAWPVSVLLLAAGLSAVSEPKSWPLPNGLGGIMGDLVAAIAKLALALLPDLLAAVVASAVMLAAGLYGILFACAIAPQAIAQLWGSDEDTVPALLALPLRALERGAELVRRIAGAIPRRARDEEDDDDYDEDDPYHELVEIEENAPFARRARGQAGPDGRIEPFFESGGEHGPTVTRAEDGVARQHRPAGVASAPVIAATYSIPPLRLLKRPPSGRQSPGLSDDELQENARMLEEVLSDFGVKGEVVNVWPGPVVTLYELEPAPGTKSSRVIGLADDIARSMSAISARVAVVPGRNAIGIELPNERREMVYLRELLEADEFEESRAELALALGKNIGGEPVVVDLARMPHLLIAGTTGSGKSVGINTMILSLLYQHDPEVCKFIMIDPKMLELSVYDGIPHLLAPVVTDPKKAVVALKWTVKEMEERYKRMSKVGVRNIHGYNARVEEAIENGETITRTVQTGFDHETGEAVYEQQEMDYEPMPYIVVIVDEMADLMMVAGKEIEGAVQRLAQMARAAGIHLITATQRPSVDVVTGTIKANFPTRVSFAVTSKVDSRTILNEQGAEQLLGQGDMLYMAGGGRITRVHGPFVSDEEVEKVVRFLKKQGVPEYLETITEEVDGDEEGEQYEGGGSGDDLYDQAVAIVLRDGKASTSYVQRRLSIGYNRAATLIERMEEEGIISAANHAGKREILAGDGDGDQPY